MDKHDGIHTILGSIYWEKEKRLFVSVLADHTVSIVPVAGSRFDFRYAYYQTEPSNAHLQANVTCPARKGVSAFVPGARNRMGRGLVAGPCRQFFERGRA